jgi:hypothetical protein
MRKYHNVMSTSDEVAEQVRNAGKPTPIRLHVPFGRIKHSSDVYVDPHCEHAVAGNCDTRRNSGECDCRVPRMEYHHNTPKYSI